MRVLISTGNWDPANYVRAVEQAGGIPKACYLPEPDLSFDALILAGGGDVEPRLYGQKNCGSDSIDFDRDRAELALIDTFVRKEKPILGICRGHQVINVWAGGGLIQDLGEQNAIHRWDDGDKVHMISASSGFLRELYGEQFRVNSAHHQSVGPIGKGLKVTARSADGVIEAMEHESLPIWAVQFHPERMTTLETVDGGWIIRKFLEQCK